jgi:hypothetical protein
MEEEREPIVPRRGAYHRWWFCGSTNKSYVVGLLQGNLFVELWFKLDGGKLYNTLRVY